MSLIHWWPLTENLLDKIDISPLSGTYVAETNGKIGPCLHTTSSISCESMTINDIDPLTTSSTITCWLRVNKEAITETFSKISSSYNAPTSTILGYNSYGGLALTWTANSYTDFSSFRVVGSVRGNVSAATPAYTMPFDTWTHIAYVVNQTTKKIVLYVNGEKCGSEVSYSGITSMKNLTGKFLINSAQVYSGNGPSTSLPMDLSDIRIYNHALNDLEVEEISKGLMLHYNFNQLPTVNICNWRNPLIISMGGHGGIKIYENDVLTLTAVDGWQAFMWDIGADNIGKTVTLSFEYYVSEIHDNDYLYVQTHTSAYYGSETKRLDKTVTTWTKETVTFSSAKQFVGFNVRGVDSSKDSMTIKVRNVKIALNDFDNIYSEYNEPASIIDESGYGHHATIYNGYAANDSASGGRSCYTPRIIETNTNATVSSTNASYIYADVFGYNFIPDEFTLAFWWKPIAWGYGNGPFGLVVGATDYLNSTVGVHDGSAKVNFADGSTNTKTACGFTGCGTGQWSHFVITGKPGEVKSYINGVRKTAVDIGEDLSLDPWRYLYLGACSAGGVLRDGDIYWGDVRYYSTALSEDDVLDLYRTKAYVTNKNVFKCGELVEGMTTTQVTANYTLESKEIFEDIYPGYDVLEYIESSGAQFIDTEYVSKTSDYTYELDMAWTGSNVTSFESFMGYMHSSQAPRAALHKYSGTLMFGANNTVNASSYPPVKNERFWYKGHFKSGDQRLYKNGAKKRKIQTNIFINTPFFLVFISEIFSSFISSTAISL